MPSWPLLKPLFSTCLFIASCRLRFNAFIKNRIYCIVLLFNEFCIPWINKKRTAGCLFSENQSLKLSATSNFSAMKLWYCLILLFSGSYKNGYWYLEFEANTVLLRKTVNVKAMCQVTQNNTKNSNTTWFHRLINVWNHWTGRQKI